MGILELLFLLMVQKTYEHWQMPNVSVETNTGNNEFFGAHSHSHETSNSPCPVHGKKDKSTDQPGTSGESASAAGGGKEDNVKAELKEP
ncbi:hypothetical protein M514_26498 [Trichuris suis]|uniref:Uncharacterized protein n=1 Tax=Trichuris suis TaxID=68888 RepID=A0A085MQ85_9BILA|nr:hypothetical protein M513_11760 [Trichuris suis]KFD59381.1 hypothetical protein M514_11760 [Trichuris suis]KFD61305.1 hypothetical protein M514_26498 [Trichuris suis]